MSYLIFLFLSLMFLKVTGLASMSFAVMFSPLLFVVILLALLFVLGFVGALTEYINSRRDRRRSEQLRKDMKK